MNLESIKAAIKHFESLQRRYTTIHNGKQCELVKTALAALRECAARWENKPLTVEELRARNGKPVWVHRFEEPDAYDHRHSCWCIVDTGYKIIEDIDGGTYHFDNLGITYLAYTYEPECS